MQEAAERSQPSESRPWGNAAFWMLFLGLFFFAVWAICDWLTSQRANVGNFYFEWEKSIPFVPSMIIPYVSIDLFFVASLFLCSNRDELDTLVKRVLFAITLSALGFLMIPLRLGFDRPEATGNFSEAFDLLEAIIGREHNLFPSLHISLGCIVWIIYRRHTSGSLRVTIGCWFVLVALSTVLIYQHHVIDIVGGNIVALWSFYLFQYPDAAKGEEAHRMDRADITVSGVHLGNWRVGLNYSLISVGCALLTYAGWPRSLLLAWPALSCAFIAAAYFGLGPGVFRKSRGRIPFSAAVLLAPCLLAARLSFLYYKRSSQPYAEVCPGVLMGRKLNRKEAEAVIRSGVTGVLDLTAEYPECRRFLSIPYKNIQILDLTAPSLDQLWHAVEFIREHAITGRIYVHCALGYSRSASVVAAYLLSERLTSTIHEAVGMIRKVRPEIVLGDESVARLRQHHSLENPNPARDHLKVSEENQSTPFQKGALLNSA